MPLACRVILSSDPPQGCSGVPVVGSDLDRLRGVELSGGVWWTTSPFLLVGTWDGHVLTLTRPPLPSRSAEPEPSPPAGCDPKGTPATTALAKRIEREGPRINLLELQPCGRRVWVLVAVADEPTVIYIRQLFGPQVLVSGWLQRLGA
jgi:hypothetical protein